MLDAVKTTGGVVQRRSKATADLKAGFEEHMAAQKAERERRVADFREAKELATWKTDNFKNTMERNIETDKRQHAAEQKAERERRVANFQESRAAAASEAEELAKWKTGSFKSMLEHNTEKERRAKARGPDR